MAVADVPLLVQRTMWSKTSEGLHLGGLLQSSQLLSRLGTLNLSAILYNGENIMHWMFEDDKTDVFIMSAILNVTQILEYRAFC